MMEHLDGLGPVASRRCQELIELNPRLFLVCGKACTLETLGSGLRRNECGQIDELPCLQSDQLIAGLTGLKDSNGRLARRDEPIRLRARGIEPLDHSSLDT